MSNTNFMPFKIFCQGALGVIIYRMYHPYISSKGIQSDNESMKLKHEADMDTMKVEHISDMNNMKAEHSAKMELMVKKITKVLENKSIFW